jgi:ATP-dependent DNA ligase
MRMPFELCLATAGNRVPDGPDWIHELKQDGYRMLVRDDKRVRLLSRNGLDWTKRYPWIAEAALKNRQKHFAIDGEAVILGVDGVSDFNALHSLRPARHGRRRSSRLANAPAQNEARPAAGASA